jgi:hypothetical protein
MAKKQANGLDLVNAEILNMVIQKLAADPTGIEAKIYYNTGTKKYRYYNGTAWADVGGTGGGGDVTGQASSVDSEIAIFSGTTGKVIKRATNTGVLKATSGVLSTATPGTDYTTPSSTESFTNKTFDANASGNALSNVEVADFAASAVNSNTSLAGASNTQFPTALAVKTFAENLFGTNDALVFKGSIDASANPNYPAADAGHTYKISVAGKVGGASGIDVQVGDTLYCTLDGSAAGNQATVGANWTIVQSNVDRATTTTLGLAEYATQAEAEAKTDATVAVTPAALATFTQKRTFTIGDGSATSFALTHNLNTRALAVILRDTATNDQWSADANCNTVNQVTLTFATAPTSGLFEATVIA